VIRQSLFAVATSQDKFLLNAGLLMLRSDRMGKGGHREAFERVMRARKAAIKKLTYSSEQ